MHPSAKLIFLLSLLLLSQLLLPHNLKAQKTNPLRIGIDLGHANLHSTPDVISNFTNILATNGAQALYSTGVLNGSYLNSIDALIISSPQTNFTSAEIGNLTSWFTSHGRLWLSASYENVTSMRSLNILLKAMGSEVRFEYGFASDPIYNLNSTKMDSDQVILPLINHAAGLPTRLTTGIRTLYAYRPVPIIGWNGTGYTKLNATLQPNATSIAETSSTAHTSNSSSAQLLALSSGTAESMPIVTIEMISNNKLALTGSPFISEWMQTFDYNQTQPYDNRILTSNILNWLTGFSTAEELEASIPEIRGTTSPLVLLYTGSQSQHTTNIELQPLLNFLSNMGFNARTFSNISFDVIRDANAIVMQAPNQLINSNQTSVINRWMQQGNRQLILASMADYSLQGNATESLSLNGLLAKLQSSLRFEQGSVMDPEVNMGGEAYLTLASNINHISRSVANLTRNVRSIYMQFGTILAGSNQTNFVPLENQTILNMLNNVTWIARTSNQSMVFNLDPNSHLQVHTQYQKNSYIVAALESYRPGKYNDTILLLGGPIFADFTRLLEYPALFGYPADNLLFMRNLFSTLVKQTETKTTINVTAIPAELSEGGKVTLNVQYNALQQSVSNLTEVTRSAITPANVTVVLSGDTLRISSLPNQTYTGSGIPTGTGQISWSASAGAKDYQSQSSSGFVQVNPLPSRFTFYVLGIPVAIFVAVTIAAVARKTR